MDLFYYRLRPTSACQKPGVIKFKTVPNLAGLRQAVFRYAQLLETLKMKIFCLIFSLVFTALNTYSQQDSLILNLSTGKFDKQLLEYSVKLEFISNKKNNISFQLEPKYVFPNELDEVGIEFERLLEGCFKKQSYSEVHPIPGLDLMKNNSAHMQMGDTISIHLEIGANLKTFMKINTDIPIFVFKGQHRIRAYRHYRENGAFRKKMSNCL